MLSGLAKCVPPHANTTGGDILYHLHFNFLSALKRHGIFDCFRVRAKHTRVFISVTN